MAKMFFLKKKMKDFALQTL